MVEDGFSMGITKSRVRQGRYDGVNMGVDAKPRTLNLNIKSRLGLAGNSCG